MRLDYRCNLPLLFPVLDPPPHQLPAVRRSIYPSVSPYMSDIFLLMETVPPDQWNVCHVLLLMPPLIASSFGILQMLLTLWFRPIICFLISAILMLASAYFCVPVLILNYAFCIRSNEILVDGFSFPSGIVYALALSLLCMFIGRHRFRNFDLY